MILLDVDPNVVKPGWIALIITLLLAAAVALLMISMRRQMRKITAPMRDDLNPDGTVRDSETEVVDQAADDATDQGEQPVADPSQDEAARH